MDFNSLIVVLCFVIYAQAKSVYNQQDVANEIIKNFKLEDAEKAVQNLQNIVDKLKDIKHNYVDRNKEEFMKKSQNALELLKEMPKECTLKKKEKVQQISMNGLTNYTLCQGFRDALNETTTLLAIGETLVSEVVHDLVEIAYEVSVCAQKPPLLVIYCLSEKAETIAEQVEDIVITITDYTTYASQEILLIAADIISCFSESSKLTDDELASLFEEVKHCITKQHI